MPGDSTGQVLPEVRADFAGADIAGSFIGV